ncbi:putative non-ribosomal peptide synthetase [Gordonia hirsuta DSM 44140 = NBRC 16056]|uniref:Putative non-ribosomal peptide synthetase n=1 Tax=Gordonia hirsuta DSM 44140 = NBRC 16056 TaxID=1121927 RepID=L7L8U3_9ACTN|nr:non-ribosomal peptide synthetase [Gordonia hirsuta]GAC56448.1 putative non-ribosomal peptide synthetase [Gordonia hirsuta DSM 44140 = NBRC 16056]
MDNPESGPAQNPVRTGRQLLPLTPAQRGMWFADRLSPDYSVNIAQYIDLRHKPGGLDIDLLMECSYEVGRELETPYIRLTEVDGVPMQYVDFEYDQTIDLLDFRDRDDPLGDALTFVQAEYRRPVDLIDDQLIVIAIILVSDDHTIWYQRAHHLIIDGYAALTNLRRVLERYNAARRGADAASKPTANLAEIVKYESDYRDSSRRETDRDHWSERVSDLPERVTLARSGIIAPLSFNNIVAGQPLGSDFQERLADVAKSLNASLAVVLTSAFGAFLSRMTGADDIALSLPIMGRTNAKIKRSGGMVSNVVPIRLQDISTKTPRELIGAGLLELTGALRHQRYRTEDIRRDAGLDASSVAFGPTINMVIFDEELVLDGADLEYRILASGVLEDLFVNLYQSGPSAPLVVDLHGNPYLYTQEEIDGHLAHFLGFLDQFASRIDAPIMDLNLLLERETETIAAEELGQNHSLSKPLTVAEAVMGRLAETPEATAVIFGDRELSNEEFGNRVSELAFRLIDLGVGPETAVAVGVPRSVEMLVALHAVVAAGGQYVPIDVSAPADRVQYMLETVDARIVLVSDPESPRAVVDVAGELGVPIELVDASCPLPGDSKPVTDADRCQPLRPDHSVYTLFTSGSTGRPKGVTLTHEAVMNRLLWGLNELPIGSSDRVVQKTPYTFDCSVPELFAPFMAGAALVLLKEDGHLEPLHVAAEIARTEATMVHFVPSVLALFLEAVPNETLRTLDSVRIISTTGEALPPSVAAMVRELWPEVLFYNLYGPTEAAVEITYESIGAVAPSDPTVPIGRPVWNSSALVLDSRLRRVPEGVPGELYLGGVQLARCYSGRPDLTAERFVADPYGPSAARLYRTGDLVVRNGSGELEYLGRTDFQVKLRGQRIELGEIEAVLVSLPGVVHAAATVVAAPSGAEHLVAYLGAPTGGTIDVDAVRAAAMLTLPTYMVPTVWTVLEDVPLNTAGKLDRKALPAPDFDGPRRSEYRAPESESERLLTELIGEMLGADTVSVTDTLFTLGGDSLAAARLAARARTVAGLEVALSDIFAAETIAALALTATPVPRGDAHPRIISSERPDRIPLSPPQTRLWFINRLDPTAPTYNMPGAVRLRGVMDRAAATAAIADVVRRHEALRTRFPSVDGEPMQVITPVEEAVAEIGLTTRAVPRSESEEVLIAEAMKGFDLVSEYPVRFSLIEETESEGEPSYILMAVLHHIAGDGASLSPMITDLLTAYAARSGGTTPVWDPLPVQYADFTLWQREMLGEADDPASRISRELAFWSGALEGSSEVLNLPTDRPRSGGPTGSGDYVDVVLGPESVAGLRRLARAEGVTTFTVLHAALSVLLSRVADTDDVSIGTAVAGRDEPELAGLVGMFVNTVVLRTRVRPRDTVAELLHHAHDVRSQAMEHSVVPFEAVVDAVAHHRSLSHSPLFQVALTLISDHTAAFGATEVQVLESRPPVAKYDLSVTAVEAATREEISLEFSYASDVFERATVERLAQYLERIITAMAADPQRSLGGIELLPQAEIAELTATPTGAEPRTLRELVQSLEQSRDSETVVAVGTEPTSNEVFAMRTNQLARELISRGAGPGTVIAIAIPRSMESVLACVAVAKTGAAFVSIDPRHPVERREMMLAISGARLGLTVREAQAEICVHSGTEWLVIDGEAVELQVAGRSGMAVGADELSRVPEIDDPAYLIFTSGSTGLPKATVVPNRGLANVMANQRRLLRLTQRSRVLHVASPSFDASVFELAMAVAGQASLVIADLHTYAGHDLERLIAQHGVTHAVMTPSALATLDPRTIPSLTTVLSAGEACPPELMRRWAEAGRSFFNLYGPTEATIWATCDGPLRVDDEITIGHPIDGVGALVLDSGLQPTPVGVVGELYLTGEQLVLGYLQRPDQTATSFVANPYEPGQRMYRTGDRATRREDGKLVYQGRIDFQLKVRGMRIEPGEVDAVLVSHPAVANSTSLGVKGPAGEAVLVSYVSPASGETISPDELLRHASGLLPAHMVPHTVIVIDEFPTTVVGKIDRSKLPSVDFTATTEFIPPRTELESVVAEVYSQVLGVDRVSVQDSFFELGGTSLSAAKLATHLSQVLGRPISVRTVFEGATVAGVAEAVAASAGGQVGPALIARPRAELVPISDVQRGMWLLNQADPSSPANNIAMALRLQGSLDHIALREAIADLVERQEALRTSYPMVGGRPVQLIEPAEKVLAELDLSPHPVGDQFEGAVAAVTGRGFDVTQKAPIRVALLQLADDDYVIVFVVHHISADGASMAPLAHDFMTAYTARHAGHRPAWIPQRVQYADFAVWQQERLDTTGEDGRRERDRQLDYWRDRLAGAPECIDLPVDRPRPATPSFSGATIDFEIPAALVASLQQVARRHNSTLFMVTHAALAILLARLSGRNDVVIGTPYAGREEAVLDDVVGMFVNTLALRSQIDHTEAFADFLERVRTEDLAAMAHSDVSFDTVAAEVGTSWTAAYNPVYQAVLSFQNLEFPTVSLDQLTVSAVSEQLSAAKVDLHLTLFPNDPAALGERGADEPMRAEFLYATDLFDEGTVERYADRYLRVLSEIVRDPQVVVGEISIATDAELEQASVETADAADQPLNELVAAAAATAPDAIALNTEGSTLTFAALSATATAMSAAMPDADAALTTALMALASEVSANPEALGEVLAELRRRAVAVVASIEELREEGSKQS